MSECVQRAVPQHPPGEDPDPAVALPPLAGADGRVRLELRDLLRRAAGVLPADERAVRAVAVAHSRAVRCECRRAGDPRAVSVRGMCDM